MYLPAFSVYPITFNSIALILLKVNLIRIAAASPFILTFSTLAAFRLNESPLSGTIIAAKLLAILVCVQPLFVLFPISNTTNDTSRRRMTTSLLLLVPMLFVMFGAAFAVCVSANPLAIFGSYAILVLLSSLILLGYRSAYRRGKFDLLTERSPR
jgi:hypothetical protein